MKALLAALLSAALTWIAFDALTPDVAEVPPTPEVVAAQQQAAEQAERDKIQADWDARVALHVGGTLSWCEPATGNRVYWSGNDWNIAVSQNDDSCPQPAPQVVFPGKPG